MKRGLGSLASCNGVNLCASLKLSLHELEHAISVRRAQTEVVPRHDSPGLLREFDEKLAIRCAQAVALTARIDTKQPLPLTSHGFGQSPGLSITGEKRWDVLAVSPR